MRGPTIPDLGEAAALSAAAELAAPADAAAAAHLYQRALDLLPDRHPARAATERALLPNALWAGRARRAEALARAALAQTPGDTGVGVQLALALSLLQRWPEAIEVLKTLLEGELTPMARARVEAELALATVFTVDLNDAGPVAEGVLARAGDDPQIAAVAYQALALLKHFAGLPADALALSERAVAAAEESDDPEVRRRNPHLFHGVFLSALGRVAEAQAALRQGRAWSERYGAPWCLPAYHWYLGQILFRTGDWDEALVELDEGLRRAEDVETTWELANLLGTRAVITIRRGRFDHGAVLVERLNAMSDMSPIDRVWRAWAGALLAEAKGEQAAACELFLAAWNEMASLGAGPAVRGMLPDLLRLCIDTGRTEVPGQVLAAVARPGAVCPPLETAYLNHVTGVARGSESHLEAAIADYEAIPYRFYVALATEELAVVRALKGHRRKALEALSQALRGYGALGARWDQRRVRARLRQLGVAAAPPRPAPGARGWDSLTPTELVVAELVAQGLRNQEIADRLFLSIQTVQTHLKHIFKKLGIRSRLQLALHPAGDEPQTRV